MIQVNVDNQSAIHLCKNPRFHDCSKHIGIKHSFLREHVNTDDGTIKWFCQLGKMCTQQTECCQYFYKGITETRIPNFAFKSWYRRMDDSEGVLNMNCQNSYSNGTVYIYTSTMFDSFLDLRCTCYVSSN